MTRAEARRNADARAAEAGRAADYACRELRRAQGAEADAERARANAGHADRASVRAALRADAAEADADRADLRAKADAELFAAREAAARPHTCHVDNQGVCHTCGVLIDPEAWHAYAGEPHEDVPLLRAGIDLRVRAELRSARSAVRVATADLESARIAAEAAKAELDSARTLLAVRDENLVAASRPLAEILADRDAAARRGDL